EEARQRVEVALAVRVLEIAAVAAHDDRHFRIPVRPHSGEVQPQVVARSLLQVEGHAVTAPFARRVWTRTFTSIALTAKMKIALPITLTCGGAPIRAAPQTNSGNVTSEPELKYVTTKSSTETAKQSSSAARIAGAISGSVTFWNVTQPFAPR